MRTATLTVDAVYSIRRSYVGTEPGALLDVERWHERWPLGRNTERPYVIHLRHDQPAVGYFEPTQGARGLPVLFWTRATSYGPFGADERDALTRAARAVRAVWSAARVSVDASQTRTAVVGEVGEDAARFFGVALVQPRNIVGELTPPTLPIDLDEPREG